jgi:hypothetical protein
MPYQYGAPKRPAQPRDIQPLCRAAVDCLAAAAGQDPEGVAAGGSLDTVLRTAPDDVRRAVVAGLRSLAEWREATERRR